MFYFGKTPAFQRISNHGASDDLRQSLALVARRLCTSSVDPEGLGDLVACCSIALNKCPGACSIGVGEVVRRITAKPMLSIVKLIILEAAGSLQLCAGQDVYEEAVHAMSAIYFDSSNEAVQLVHANNAFNCLNCQVSLCNMQTFCPPFANILINTYRKDAYFRWRHSAGSA